MSCLIRYNYQYVYIDSESKMKLGPKARAKVFDDQKARNLIKSPPKNMRLYKFELESLTEGKTEQEIKQEQILMRAAQHAKKTGCYTEIKNDNKPKEKSEVNDVNNIDNWLKKLSTCNGIKREAQERLDYLSEKLSLIDQAQDIILHMIEKNEHPNAPTAYKQRMKILEIRKKRRKIKNEMIIVQMIVANDLSSRMYDHISAVSNGLQYPQNLDEKYNLDVADELLKKFDQL